jgi:hypothetical protein
MSKFTQSEIFTQSPPAIWWNNPRKGLLGFKVNSNNYRPISVLSVISKIFEKSIFDQLHEYLTTQSQAPFQFTIWF